jgi:hypothetical protein
MLEIPRTRNFKKTRGKADWEYMQHEMCVCVFWSEALPMQELDGLHGMSDNS